jgi:uncharacterized protein (TIGR01777 family)
MRILVTGITGFIGRKLGERLAGEGHEIVALVRDPGVRLPFPADLKGWDTKEISGIDAVIHLAGESIAARRWSEAQKKRILSSRTETARKLGRIVKNPPLLISASGIGFYGDRGEEELTESSPRGGGFLADVCEEWENSAKEIGAARTVMLRTGMVLGRDGGALAKILPLFRAGLGGKLGSGRQWVSWIHLDDIVSLYLFALKNGGLEGAVNAVAPFPVTNEEFTKVLAKAVNRPAVLPAPSFALKLALGEMSTLLLASQRVKETVSGRGFPFKYRSLSQAMAEITA